MEMLSKESSIQWCHVHTKLKYFYVVHFKKIKNTYLVVYLISSKLC